MNIEGNVESQDKELKHNMEKLKTIRHQGQIIFQ